MDINGPEFEYFLDLSVVLTGFSRFHLQGTGQAALYFETVLDIIGEDIFGELLQTFHTIDIQSKNKNYELILNRRLRSEILGSEKLGPIARNIIKLWYVANWYQLPPGWRNVFGAKENDQTFIPSPQAYPEGLLWPTIGVNPPGAKGLGYATWSEHPSVKISRR
ncbi:hypothetical protein [Limnofasciculus baicalensis]|uniref:Uncharacterized protein n=1 Tax=Limnofasciculus baicalensis BBK-W-15 TaxID=2699891 RepID=A0AAE3GQ78_9CYAN|nr:hypothetical protein [Limnofasciculus baicalensis]MCP2727833.1 hypothetical protein [Limnofasciculus baicalensis BBK-W-15]